VACVFSEFDSNYILINNISRKDEPFKRSSEVFHCVSDRFLHYGVAYDTFIYFVGRRNLVMNSVIIG